MRKTIQGTIQVPGSEVPGSRFELRMIGQLLQKDLIQILMQNLFDFCAIIYQNMKKVELITLNSEL